MAPAECTVTITADGVSVETDGTPPAPARGLVDVVLAALVP
jgi:hypothetical protein